MAKFKKRPVMAEDPQPRRRPQAPAGKRVDTSKQPRRAFEPGDPTGRLVVRFGSVDTDGPWCLSGISPAEHVKMLGRLRGIETMTVHEVFSNGKEPGKHYEVHLCPNRAVVDRLHELNYDDETRISRLRFGGKGRLFGFLRDTHFHALWWDPEHEIWPSKLKNT